MTSGGTSTSTLAGRSVSRVGYGAMQLEAGRIERDAAVRLVREAVDLGVDHLDTADFYPGVNAVLREALTPDDEALIATKIGAVRDADGALVPAQKPAELRAQVAANRVALGVERLDLVYLRRVDARPGIVATGDQVVDLDDQLAVLTELRDAGAIGAIALSAVDAATLERALPAGIAAVQNGFNLLDRHAAPVHDLCREHGIAWVPFFPLGSGFPGQPRVTDDPRVIATADRLGATPSQVGLAWLLADPATLLIPGTRSAAHLRENLAAADVVLDAEALAALG